MRTLVHCTVGERVLLLLFRGFAGVLVRVIVILATILAGTLRSSFFVVKLTLVVSPPALEARSRLASERATKPR